jgi:hypothetical protein
MSSILDVGTPGEKGGDERERVLDELAIAHGYADMREGVATKTLLELLDNWTSQIRDGGWEAKTEDLLDDIEDTRAYVNGALDRLRDHLKATHQTGATT